MGNAYGFRSNLSRKQTSFLFFGSLKAASAKSFCGTNLCFGRKLATPINICVTNHGGVMLSAIYKKCLN